MHHQSPDQTRRDQTNADGESRVAALVASAIRIAATTAAIAFGSGVKAETPASTGCTALARASIPAGEVFSAILEPRQAYRFAGALKSVELSPRCIVRAQVRSGPDSHVVMELWLPLHQAWNGRIQAAGRRLRGGGRQGQRYFASCSTDGQQGLMEAQHYPSDFDGILVGAPDNNRTGLNAGFPWRFAVNNVGDAPTIPADKLRFINAAVIRACDDGLDGVRDGVIDDPRTCPFRPDSIACRPGRDGPDCLTPPQVAVLASLERDAGDPKDGSLIYPAWPLGSEDGWGGYVAGRDSARLGVWRDWVFDDTDWSWRSVDWTRDLATARSRLGALIDAADPDLRPLRDHGGKLRRRRSDPAPARPLRTIRSAMADPSARPSGSRLAASAPQPLQA